MYEPVRPRQRRKRNATQNAIHQDDGGRSIRFETPSNYYNSHQYQLDGRQGVQPKVPATTLAGHDAFGNTNLAWTPTLMADVSPTLDVELFDANHMYPGTVEEDVEEIERHEPFDPYLVQCTTNSPSLALIAPIPIPSPRFEFQPPAFSEFSHLPRRRALISHFCNVLSHLIVFREEDGNPFQRLVLPLTKSSSAVTNSIYALASAHLEHRGVGVGEKSAYYHQQAIQSVAGLIERGGGAKQNELLASIMLLVYYEVVRPPLLASCAIRWSSLTVISSFSTVDRIL